jgi:Peptidase family M28
MMTRPSVRAIACMLCMAFLACSNESAPGNDTISQSRLSVDLYTLAADSMRGRLVGTAESGRAADWIAERFASLGLEPAGDGGTYFQRFDLTWFSLGDGNRLNVSGAGRAGAPGNGWTPSSFSATAEASGGVVFAGFGIVEPRLGFDDYGREMVRGKIVLVLEREPGVDDAESPFDGLVTAEASRDWRKALAAQERGAAGILFVRDVQNRADVDDWAAAHAAAWPEETRRVERFTLADWVGDIEIPSARISVALAEALVAGSGRPLAELAAEAEAAESGLGVVPLPGARASMRIAVERHATPARNVLAMIEGSDPTLRDEVVIVGAHYDHNGADGEDVYNGADDDGSGTVGVLAVAAAYADAAAHGDVPKRSLLFAIWDAEERGLLGAWYYTLRPLFPLQSTVADLNLDMIGRNEEVPTDGGRRFRGLAVQSAEENANAVNILGYSRTLGLAELVSAANKSYGLTLRMRYDNNASNLLRRSDHWPFLENEVPAVWFHTGLHPDYHTPRDVPDRINFEKMTRIVQLVHRTSWYVAEATGRPGMALRGPRPAS